jgi:signal transduction histidine kinase
MGFRTKLIISYAGLIFLTLAMSIGLFFVVLQQIQQAEKVKAEQRLQQLTNDFGRYIKEPQYSKLTDYRQQSNVYARFLNVRILLIDERNVVQVDTASEDLSLLEKTLPDYTLVSPRDNKPHPGYMVLNGTTYRYYALVGTQIREEVTNRTYQTDFVVGVPEATLAFSLSDVLLLTIGAALVALIAAILVAFLIARTITRPITRMTSASEAIAQGDYNQRLELSGKGTDEVSRLAISFNRMAIEVARSQQAMRDFVANVSHELKTPLTSIQGYSQAIVDGMADTKESITHSAEIINDEAARMRRLVDALLDLSRIEAGQAEMRWSEIKVIELVRRVIVRTTPLAIQKNVYIREDLHAYQVQIHNREGGKLGLPLADSGSTNLQLPLVISENDNSGPVVWGDADRLEQVFTNILDNAIKYSPENGVVTVEIKLCNNPNTATNNRFYWVVIAIGNNGPLIPEELQSRIFERFYKMDKSRVKKKGESTGLGLAIAKELVEAHRGMITVESGMVSVVRSQEMYPYPIETQEALTTFSIKLPLLSLPVNAEVRGQGTGSRGQGSEVS